MCLQSFPSLTAVDACLAPCQAQVLSSGIELKDKSPSTALAEFSSESVHLLQVSQYVPREPLGHRKHIVHCECSPVIGLPQNLSLDKTVAFCFLERFLQKFQSCNMIYNLINFSCRLEHTQMVYLNY